MKLGVFSDLHSNIYALNAMWQSASDVDEWLSLGDCVGLFPGVNEVLDWCRARRVHAVGGNHEACLLDGGTVVNSFSGNESLAHQRQSVSAVNLAYLRTLSPTLTLTLDGWTIRAMHGLPNTVSSGKYDVDLQRITSVFADADIVLFGDTHLPFLAYGPEQLVLNPGSCGFPVDLVKRPSFAVIDTATAGAEVRRFDYETQPLIDDIGRFGYNPALARFVRAGKWVG